jgi:hypothetical protein
LLRRLYGPRSERLNPDQLLLFSEPPAPEAMTPAVPTEPGESMKPRRKGHGRQQLPRHLPRDRRVYELSEAERRCRGCGQARVVIGQEVSEQLDYEPASLKVIEHVRLPERCDRCQEPLPPQPGPQDPEPSWHQLAELPPVATLVMEYQGHYRACTRCGRLHHDPIPQALKASSLGPRLAAPPWVTWPAATTSAAAAGRRLPKPSSPCRSPWATFRGRGEADHARRDSAAGIRLNRLDAPRSSRGC